MYPEHEKVTRAQGDIDILGKFVEWLRQPNSRLRICYHEPGIEGDLPAGWYPYYEEPTRLIHLYLGINPDILERERRGMENSHRDRVPVEQSRHVPAAKIAGIVHLLKWNETGFITGTGCGLLVNRSDLMLVCQRPEDITCPALGCRTIA